MPGCFGTAADGVTENKAGQAKVHSKMSLWSRVVDFISDLADPASRREDSERLRRVSDREVAFTISIICLGAKLAKVDGRVTVDEVRAFRQIFRIPQSEEKNAAKVFNYARRNSDGYEYYAGKVAGLYADKPKVLDDIMEALFRIATADGAWSESEEGFLYRVNQIFGLSDSSFQARRMRFEIEPDYNPYQVLGVKAGSSLDEIRSRWKKLVKETHPDILSARGIPAKDVKIAEDRLAGYNKAWDVIEKQHSR